MTQRIDRSMRVPLRALIGIVIRAAYAIYAVVSVMPAIHPPPAPGWRRLAAGGVDYGIVAVCLVLLGLAGVLGRTAGLLPAHINISLRRGLGRPRRPPRGDGCRWR
jgi:hypothetical protein